MDSAITVTLTECQDYCDDAPAITMLPGPYPYIDLTPTAVRAIVAEHVCGGQPVRSLLHKDARRRLKTALWPPCRSTSKGACFRSWRIFDPIGALLGSPGFLPF